LAVTFAVLLLACSSPPQKPLRRGVPLPQTPVELRHERDVRRIAVSPSGDMLATIAADAIHLRRLPSLEPVAAINGMSGLEFARDVLLEDGARQLVVLSETNILYLWDSKSLQYRTITPAWTQTPRRLLGFVRPGLLAWLSTSDDLVLWAVEGSDFADNARTVLRVGYSAYVQRLGANRWMLWGDRARLLTFTDAEASIEVLEKLWFSSSTTVAPALSKDGARLFFLQRDELYCACFEEAELRRLESEVLASRRVDVHRLSHLLVTNDALFLADRDGDFEKWSLSEPRLEEAWSLPAEMLRDVWPRKILDLAEREGELLVLLPEQHLLRMSQSDGSILASIEL
jgi:WD40 repeat protein